MGIMRHGKPDGNQAEIVKALRGLGCSVDITSGVGKGFPDLAVGRNGVTLLLEVKDTGNKLDAEQVIWHNKYKGAVEIVRTIGDAIEAVNRCVKR